MYRKSTVSLIVLLLLIINQGTRAIQLSEEEKLDMERQYQILNRTSIKTIKTKNGAIYDCVDFYKQPAFDHPLLKNHTFYPEMRPNNIHGSIKSMSSNDDKCSIKKLEDGGCPPGTVPIKRVSLDDFIQIKSFTRDYALRRKSNSQQPRPGQQFAIVQTNSDPSKTKYYGARGLLNDYHLSIGESQYSSGELIIQNGDDMVKFGWTVNPTINKDNKVHLFQYLSAGQSHCFNTLCPGFVSTNKDIPVDTEIVGGSKRGGTQRGIGLLVYQDAQTKNWWYQFCGVNIGFWPHQIFSAMADGATYVAVGGEAYAPPNQPLPPMGNGYYPSEDLTLTAYCRNFTVLDANHQHINPQQTEKYTTNWHYGVYDMGSYGSHGRLICYGGTTM